MRQGIAGQVKKKTTKADEAVKNKGKWLPGEVKWHAQASAMT
jgi:hypothetical protein